MCCGFRPGTARLSAWAGRRRRGSGASKYTRLDRDNTSHRAKVLVAIVRLFWERDVDHKQEFKQHLSNAILSFESAQRQFGKPGDNAAKTAVIETMVFQCERARRIVRDEKIVSESLGFDQQRFLESTKDISTVRHVTEHGSDVKNPRPRKTYSHTTKQGLTIGVDEASLIFVGPDEIYKGPVNLHDVCLYIKSIFQTLP
jgi:hypothetical protein